MGLEHTLGYYIFDVVGSSEFYLLMQNLARAYNFDKESGSFCDLFKTQNVQEVLLFFLQKIKVSFFLQ